MEDPTLPRGFCAQGNGHAILQVEFEAENDEFQVFFGMGFFSGLESSDFELSHPPPCLGLGYESGRSELTEGLLLPRSRSRHSPS